MLVLWNLLSVVSCSKASMGPFCRCDHLYLRQMLFPPEYQGSPVAGIADHLGVLKASVPLCPKACCGRDCEVSEAICELLYLTDKAVV